MNCRGESKLPILPDIEKKLQKYATDLEQFSIYEYERCQIHWLREAEPLELLHFEESPLCTSLQVQRDPFTGEILDYHEVSLQAAGATAQNSMSVNRAPAPPSEATRGNASYMPFWPGSFPNPILELPKQEDLSNTELLTVPPGFTKGLIFDTDGMTVLNNMEDKASARGDVPDAKNVINLLELVHQEQNILGTWGSPKKVVRKEQEERIITNADEDEIIPKDVPILEISKSTEPAAIKGTEWAILLDTSKSVKNFRNKIPNMAHNFPFELDTFQKLAILQLEKHNHVFVAAHTSAGKTVVAEYAIALSQKHLTRTIYTSPIKALSNQKYRDFKRVFKDVGLITGDFQINQTASCLIMTTEILRSMLYCGSDISRDLEYVIFDEVHYINDRERGHVWEQVLILLPEHVCVVLLSATVPNTIEFADWLGRTHQRKVYVITTLHRPVPLKHYLYTGTGGATRNNRFLVLNVNAWKMEGYIQAKNTLLDTEKKFSERGRQFTLKQDMNLWTGLIDHLKREELLPVVVFTFSRAKCDRNAANLKSTDLTTEREKSKIHMFFRHCIKNLKDEDREIPQIILMENILKRGIGVHHSGVLPIVKEIVEMLFQNGLIKLLFATETFAMGVNMPARTVIFDSITKHDGEQWRNLMPAEYIQMAGRAGRRGLDKEGTVIILCKGILPPELSFREMMLGKPNLLKSQFRLTYGMVLSLLRVERLTVEGMMSRSFREADHQKNMVVIQQELEAVEKEIEDLCSEQLSNYLQPLVKYFECSRSYLKSREEILPNVMTSAKLTKVLVPGRILLISWKIHINKLALLLQVTRQPKLQFKVLVLTENKLEDCDIDDKTDLWYKMLALASDVVFVPLGNVSHDILTIGLLDILEISSKTLKINTELVLKDWNNRQLTRFRNDAPGQSCGRAIQELHKMSLSSTNRNLDYLHFIRDLKIDERQLYENLNVMYALKDKLIDHLPSTQIPNFIEQFSIVFTKKYLEEKKSNLKFQLSKESLSLYPDYENRIELLQTLKYVDSNNRVLMKGKVACEMGMNELLITELVLQNVLKDLSPAEVAALLSTLVFRVRAKTESDESKEQLSKISTPTFKKAITELKRIHLEILNLEGKLNLRSEEIQEDLNFGLVAIVHEWASNKSFAEIKIHTEIQEGIIVRCIQQLNDTICDVKDAARIVGDPRLQSIMEDASAAIKRDIVFAASLYTQGDSTFM